MTTFEQIAMVVIVVLTGSIITIVYFYTKHREKYLIEKIGTKIESKDKKFEWDMPEEKTSEEKKFSGVAIWEKESTAQERIVELQKQLSTNILRLNMFETFLISKKFGQYIILETSGVFYISRKHIEKFINELTFDIEMIKELDQYVQDHIENINYEIDIKTLFYVMKNSSSLGLQNVSDGVQVFNFSSKDVANNETIGDVAIFKVKDDLEDIDSSTKEIKNENTEDSDIILLETPKTTVDDDGNTHIHYADNFVVVKQDPWTTIDVIINGVSRKEKQDQNNNQNNNKNIDFNKLVKYNEIKLFNNIL